MADTAELNSEIAPLTEELEESNDSHDLTSSEYYLNRELTWLEFNKRVLNEAKDPRTPLLERLKFIAIVGSNLDEFFMKRLGGLKQQVGAGVASLTVDGRSPQQQIDECNEVVRQIEADMATTYQELTQALREHDIAILSYEELDEQEQANLRNYYYDNIFPLVTPQSIDPAQSVSVHLPIYRSICWCMSVTRAIPTKPR